MKTQDMRFDQELIQSWIGQKFDKYRCDPFIFTNSVAQIIGLYIGHEVYALTNLQESVDYFGYTDDYAVCKLFITDNARIKSPFIGVEMIDTPVGDTITAVTLVNEEQKLAIQGEPAYDVWLTRAIIIEAGGREISFEKDTVPFSEEIIIQRGYNLLDKILDNEDFYEGWQEGYVPECRRKIITIK